MARRCGCGHGSRDHAMNPTGKRGERRRIGACFGMTAGGGVCECPAFSPVVTKEPRRVERHG